MDPIVFEHIWKRYKRGSRHDSLRDAIPGMLAAWRPRRGRELKDGEFWAVRDVTFRVRQGETIGLVGHNGAGKSTILKLLSQITSPTEGALEVRGRLAALIELGGGFHPDLTGAENIYLQGTMLGLSHRQIKARYDSIVAFSDLAAFLQTPVKRYSSGMVVRLGFAIAAQVDPDVLLIDEVLAVGDLGFQQKCFKRIAELKNRGTTMIFISHNLEAVQKLCDRVLLLQDGRILQEGAPGPMIQHYRRDAFLGKLKQDRSGGARHTGPVAITRVELRAPHGQPVELVETGQPLSIDIAYRTQQPIRDPSFRIGIERMDGMLCHSTSSRADGLPAEPLEGEGVVRLDYLALNLLPNFYQVTVELLEGRNPVPLAAVRQQCYFQITSDFDEHGAVHLSHRWVLDGRSTEINGAAAALNAT